MFGHMRVQILRIFSQIITSSLTVLKNTPGGIRTHNLWFRKPFDFSSSFPDAHKTPAFAGVLLLPDFDHALTKYRYRISIPQGRISASML